MAESPPNRPFSRRLAAFWSPPLPKTAAKEFRAVITRTNLSRLKIFAYCAIILTPFLLLVDYMVLLGLAENGFELFEELLILHLVLIAGAVYLILKTRKSAFGSAEPLLSWEKRLEPSAVFFLLIWTAVFTGIIHPLGAGIGSYLLVLCVSVAFIIQSGPRVVVLLTTSLLILVAMILFLGHDLLQIKVDILNSVGMTAGAILVSQILFRTSVKEFVSDKLIAKQKEQVERINFKLQNTNERLVRLSFVDPLTGIANRRYLDEYLEREWRRALRDGEELALIMADIDHFKDYNDIYGHPAGDDCLTKVAEALDRSPSRGADLVARFGGEEFAVILPRTDLRGALELAEKMRRTVAELRIAHSGNDPGVVTVSLGAAAVVPREDKDAESLVEAADQNLYKAKEEGRNRVRPES